MRFVFTIGETADELAAAVGARAVIARDLGTAARMAAAEAQPGDVVLLSPACASYDQFESFEERGEEFRRLAQNLTRWPPTSHLGLP